MNRWIKNERGLTLIELLAATILTAIIAIFAFSILMKGIQHYNTISTDTAFRDEADLLMSSLLKDLYTTKESQITKTHFPERNTDNYFFEIDKTGTNKLKTGFINKELYIQNKVIPITNSAIQITKDSKIVANQDGDGVYEITLELHMPLKNQTVKFINEIRTISDINEDKED